MKNKQNKGQGSKGVELTSSKNDLALVALERLANRQAFRACQSLRSGKPAGKGRGWRLPMEVSRASEVEAGLAGKYALILALHRAFGDRWADRVQWLPEYGPFSRRQIAFKRWLSLTAWRGSFNDLTQLPCGVTGQRASGVRALFVDLDAEEHEEARNQAFALFAPDCEDSGWLESSIEREARRASDIKKAKRIVFERYLAPFKGLKWLTKYQRQSKLSAIRRAVVVGFLLDGQSSGMRSDNLKRVIKPLFLAVRTGKRGQKLGRSLASQLASL